MLLHPYPQGKAKRGSEDSNHLKIGETERRDRLTDRQREREKERERQSEETDRERERNKERDI